MNKNDIQESAIIKAQRYKNSKRISEALGKAYLQFCSDDFISFNAFLQKANILQKKISRVEVNPTIPFREFLRLYERELTLKEKI